MVAYRVPAHSPRQLVGPVSQVLGPTAIPVVVGGATANAVAATVTAAGNNATFTVSSSASAVTATVTVTAANPVGKGTANASSVTATVTAAATNPTVKVSSAASSVTATVTAAAANPVAHGDANASSVTASVTVGATNAVGQIAGDGTANSVTATVTVAATNPTTKLSANPPSVTATVTVAATNPTVTRLSNASAVTATVTVAATNPTFTRTANPPSVTALVTVTAANAIPITFPYPASISGRKILDQNGNVFLMRTLSSWAVTWLPTADITTALEGAVTLGFNAVTIWCGGGYSFHGTWNKYQNDNGQNFWSGTPWQSSFGAGFATVDWAISECRRLGLIVNLSFCGGADADGSRADWASATNAQMRQVGIDVATRYPVASNPHIVWHVMFDAATDATTAARIDALFGGINDTEGAGARPVRWCEPQPNNTTYLNFIAGTPTFANCNWTINTWYRSWNIVPASDTGKSTEIAEAVWAESTMPMGDAEPPYDGNPDLYAGVQAQQLRERTWTGYIEGACMMAWGHEDWWAFGRTDIYNEAGITTWVDVITHIHAVQQTYIWPVIDTYVKDATWAPSALLTGGAGTGDVKAASGSSNTAGLVYFPDSRGSITVDTTLLTGTGNVRLRWYDPTNGAYSTIAASEAQNASRALTYPGNNSAGESDQVFVVDLASSSSASANAVTATVTVTANNPTVTVLSNASAVTATVTAAAANPVAHGDANASAVTATVTVAGFNATGQTTSAGTANPVTATVTVDATNPVVKVSSAASSVTATVVVAATNPTVTRESNANAVTATVTVAGFNPTTKLTANPPSVFAAVTVTAANAVGQVNAAGTANAVTALVVVAATNPTVTRLSNAGALNAGVTAAAANATTKLTASIVAVYAAVLAEAFNASSIRLGLRASTTSVRIASATVAATLTSSTGTDSITAATATEDIT